MEWIVAALLAWPVVSLGLGMLLGRAMADPAAPSA